MGGDNDDGSPSRSAIPLIAGAIVTAQATMSIATIAGDRLTEKGFGRKPLFLFGLITLPLRCALIIYWKDAGDAFLLSTQVFDGLGGGFFGLIHPYLVADITFGTGRFNLVSKLLRVMLKDLTIESLVGLTASCFGLGATLSNYIGQTVVEKLGHVASLSGSLVLSFIPVILFACFMPETMGKRGNIANKATEEKGKSYTNMEMA
eukprot:8829177-Ditylum_brightwellii.AAC.1